MRNIHTDTGLVMTTVGFTLTSFSTMVVGLRFYCRYFLMGTIASYDWIMLSALLLTWGNTVLNYYQDHFGKSIRFSLLREGKEDIFARNLSGVLVTWYVYRITYVFALCLVKMSILFFYRSIASHINFRRAVYTTMAFVGLYSLGMIIASIFQCQNPSDAWSIPAYLSQPGINVDHRKHSKCYSPTTIVTFSAAANLLSDVVILLLPIPTMLGLRIPLSKRLALIGIFSVGIMAIVASCIRLWVLALWSESVKNQVVFGADLLLWGQIEVNSGIISASIPFLRLLLKRVSGSSKSDQHSPPHKPQMALVGTSNKPLELTSVQIFEGEQTPPNGSPTWRPFITVPTLLSSRGSIGRYDPTRTA